MTIEKVDVNTMQVRKNVEAGILTALTAVITTANAGTFSDDVDFMRKHVDVVVLGERDGQAMVAIVPAYQGRVMTSTSGGFDGKSHGWVNRERIASGTFEKHINVFGGEDRFWLGPEGGQYSIFFAKDVPFNLEHWFTPAALDTEPFELVDKTNDRALFRRQFQLVNTSGFTFDLEVTREVRLMTSECAAQVLGGPVPEGVRLVAYESDNKIKNAGTVAWTKNDGLLSIWILGMFNAAPSTTVIVPYQEGPDAELGPIMNDSYFGTVPVDRLVATNGLIYFKADARYRSKIGVGPLRARNLLGSYDPDNRVLTLVQFTLPEGVTDYVNSMWEHQEHPFSGDVVNSYNDGPPAPGANQLGQFYELESSSPALALAPGETGHHLHRTLHVQGDEAALDVIARRLFGTGLEAIQSALPSLTP